MNSLPSSRDKALGYWPEFLVGLHAFKILYFFRNVNIASEFPLVNHDFIMYYARALRMHEFFRQSGQFWGYDPFNMAGYVAGPIHETGSHLLSLLCYFAAPIIPIRAGLLLLEFAGFFLMPFFIKWAVTNLGGTKSQSWFAFALAVLAIGAIEPMSSLVLLRGIFGFLLASTMAVWQVGLAWRWLQTRKWADLGLLVIATVGMFQLHPLSIFLSVIPLAIFFAAHARSMKGWHHAAACFAILLFVASIWHWLRPYTLFSDWRGAVQNFHSGTAAVLKSLINPIQSSWIGSVRVVAMCSMLGFVIFRSQKPGKAFNTQLTALSGAVFFCLIAVLIGTYIPVLNDLQPGRFIFPLWMFLLVAVSLCFRSEPFSSPVSLPVLSVLFLTGWSAVTTTDAPALSTALPPDQLKVVRYIYKEAPFPGRVLLESDEHDAPVYQDMLAVMTKQPFLGGSNPGNFLKTHFTVFSGTYFAPDLKVGSPTIFERPLQNFPEAEFASYLELYNVSTIIARSTVSIQALNGFSRTLSFRDRVGGYNVYDVAAKPGWMVEGQGRVSMDYDRITVADASPTKLTLKFHWLSTLKTDPPVPIAPVFLKDDPVPFITLDNAVGHPSIVIRNETLRLFH